LSGESALAEAKPKDAVDVLYIHPFCGEDDQFMVRYAMIPMGVIPILNRLAGKGYTIRGVNCPLEYRHDRSFTLEKWLQDQSFRVVLIDINWYVHLSGGIKAAAACKKAIPSCRVIVGGMTASCFAAEILKRHPHVDFVVRGEGDVPAVDLVHALLTGNDDMPGIENISYRDRGEIRENPLTFVTDNLDGLNYLDIDWLESKEKYYYSSVDEAINLSSFWLAVARGCNYWCYHCGASRQSYRKTFGRKKIVKRSPERIVKDIQELVNRGVQNIGLSHDLTHLGGDYWREIFRLIRKNQIRIGVMHPFWRSLPDEEFVNEFKSTFILDNSCLNLSIESGVEELRRLIHQEETYDNETFLKTVKMLHDHKMRMIIYWRLNMPFESKETLEISVKLAAKICKMFPENVPLMECADVPMDPLSPIACEPEKFDYAFPILNYDDYFNISRGILSHRRIWCYERRKKLKMRDYPELDDINNIDIVFIKKMTPLLFARWHDFEIYYQGGETP
jgi:radical SAM superfamily enzyme YgiQ (UPF0313 family)